MNFCVKFYFICVTIQRYGKNYSTKSIAASIEKVWEYWNSPEHISGWAFASDDWGAEGISNTLEPNGTFHHKMFAKDGSAAFDFIGTYTTVVPLKSLAYTLEDGRTVTVDFIETETSVDIVQQFDPETENPTDMQQAGWQAYLDNFKKYVEGT